MYTQAQIQAITEFKKILESYNKDQITYQEYIAQTIPLWNILGKIFEDNEKTS